MKGEWQIIGPEGLQFCGKMSASISHEIKNMLAIINESAGLLEDLIFMSEQGGGPVDLERLKTVAGRVKKQVSRANQMIKNMNQFAHSYDEAVKSVDLAELLALMTELSLRFISLRGVTVEPRFPEPPVVFTTIPFFLENMVWRCLDFAMDAAGEGKNIGLEAEGLEDGVRIRFTQLAGLTETSKAGFPGPEEQALMDALEADLAADAQAREIVLTLPRDIGS